MNSKPFCPNEMFISPTWMGGWISWGTPPRLSQPSLFFEILFFVFSRAIELIFWPEDLFHFIGGSESWVFFKVAQIISSLWFQLLWKHMKGSVKMGEHLPRFLVCENSKTVWSFTTQIFMQFLPMAFGPLAVHLYILFTPFGGKDDVVTTMEMTRTTGNVGLLHCIQLQKCSGYFGESSPIPSQNQQRPIS